MTSPKLIKGEIGVGAYPDNGKPLLKVIFGSGRQTITIAECGGYEITVEASDVMAVIAALSRAHEEISGGDDD